jgi:ribosomal protein S18 acetylase RimI-like enzyme
MIELRPAQFRDHASIALLHAESWRNTYRGIYSDRYLDDEVERDRLAVWHDRLRFPTANQEIMLAVQDKAVVGFACLFLDDDATYGTLLDNLHVSFYFRKAGIGKLLMRKCAHSIVKKGINTALYLWVFKANQNARQFYERLGGANVETAHKENEDGTQAKVCRYFWADITALL